MQRDWEDILAGHASGGYENSLTRETTRSPVKGLWFVLWSAKAQRLSQDGSKWPPVAQDAAKIKIPRDGENGRLALLRSSHLQSCNL